MPKASRNDEPLLRATRYAANPGFVLLVSFYLILRMNSLAQATAVSYLTLRVGWQRGDPPTREPPKEWDTHMWLKEAYSRLSYSANKVHARSNE